MNSLPGGLADWFPARFHPENLAAIRQNHDYLVPFEFDLLFGHVCMLLDAIPRTALSAISPAAIRGLDRDNLAFYMTKHAESSLRVMSGTSD